jgi:hypothetical protein
MGSPVYSTQTPCSLVSDWFSGTVRNAIRLAVAFNFQEIAISRVR